MSITTHEQHQVTTLQARVHELQKRLEISADHGYDGITSRDVAIRELEKTNSHLKLMIKNLEKNSEEWRRIGQLQLKEIVLTMVEGTLDRDPTLQELVRAIEEL